MCRSCSKTVGTCDRACLTTHPNPPCPVAFTVDLISVFTPRVPYQPGPRRFRRRPRLAAKCLLLCGPREQLRSLHNAAAAWHEWHAAAHSGAWPAPLWPASPSCRARRRSARNSSRFRAAVVHRETGTSARQLAENRRWCRAPWTTTHRRGSSYQAPRRNGSPRVGARGGIHLRSGQ